MLLGCDFHVHLYPCWWRGDESLAREAVRRILAHTARRAATIGLDGVVLCLTERHSECPSLFESVLMPLLSEEAATSQTSAGSSLCSAGGSLALCSAADPRHEQPVPVLIYPGFQVVTAEGLEVHALGTRNRPSEGSSLSETVREIREGGGTVMLGWGLGKWLGSRGRILERWFEGLSEQERAQTFLCDSRHRLWGWPAPSLFAVSQNVLHGSDPLPLRGEETALLAFGETRELTTGADARGLGNLTLAEVLSSPSRALVGARLDPITGGVLQLRLRL